MNTNATTADTATEDYLYEVLIPRETDLSNGFAWDPSTKGFAWTGTTEQFDALQAVRAEIAAHPLMVAEQKMMMRAEARMNR
ncbi:MAG TPA: hypothetical protein VMW08_05485 [Acidimicrobiales bacterium]|nr:hypothetical protein [Acidimicrobiales bacterium]